MRKEITEEQITELMRAIPRAEEVERLRGEVEKLTRERDEARAEVERLRKEMLEVAEELENEEPRSHKNIAFGIRNVLEAKP